MNPNLNRFSLFWFENWETFKLKETALSSTAKFILSNHQSTVTLHCSRVHFKHCRNVSTNTSCLSEEAVQLFSCIKQLVQHSLAAKDNNRSYRQNPYRNFLDVLGLAVFHHGDSSFGWMWSLCYDSLNRKLKRAGFLWPSGRMVDVTISSRMLILNTDGWHDSVHHHYLSSGLECVELGSLRTIYNSPWEEHNDRREAIHLDDISVHCRARFNGYSNRILTQAKHACMALWFLSEWMKPWIPLRVIL